MKKIRIDWFKAKEDFLMNWNMTLKEVARKYNLSYSKIRNVSAKRGWYEDKKQFQKLLSETLMKEVEFKVTDDLLERIRQIKPSLGEKYLKRREQAMKGILRKMKI